MIRNKKLTVGILFIAVLGVFYFIARSPAKAPGVSGPDYKNIPYVIDGTAVALKDGQARTESAPGSASQTITQYFGNEARADFNGDGLEDVAFLLTQTGGGTGTFYYAVAALKTSDGYRGTNAVLLGDRIAPQTTEYRDGNIIVNYADRKPGEPMSAQPSVGVSAYLQLRGDQLVLTAK